MGLYERLLDRQDKIAVIGLGYVGLPIAVAFANKVNVIGFDVNQQKIEAYLNGDDPTGDTGADVVRTTTVEFTSEVEKLRQASFYIVAVPTPLNIDKVPDLKYVRSASEMVGQNLTPGSIVVYESTVYPGVTEEICIPILESESGLRCGIDFKVGYSPERINPGDKVHRLESIVKIVSGIDHMTLDIVAKVYELVIDAGVHRAANIKVAEAAKVIENAQRDINIAFMNELSMLFHMMGVNTQDVLKAAGTKWNFMDFKPGLVGGHCIGIDPYYLTYKAEGTGYHSKIILAGRQVNDAMGKYVAQQVIKILVKLKEDINNTKVGVLGIAYKENCEDVRNTKVCDILRELTEFGITTMVADPVVNPKQVQDEYGIELYDIASFEDMNVIIVAVPHQCYAEMSVSDFDKFFRNDKQQKILIDVRGFYDRSEFESQSYYYWSL